MEGGPTITRSPMPVVKEPEGISDEFERRRADTLGLPIDIETAARPMFGGERGKPSLQEAAIKIRVVGYDKHHSAQQIVDDSVVDAMTGDHLIGNAGDLRDLGGDGKAGIFEPLPGAENSVDRPV
jgi:hypothetical protein